MREALAVALSHRLDSQTGRAYHNLYGLLVCERRYAEAEPYYRDGLAYCDERDVSAFGTSMRGEHSVTLARTDRWDESAALASRLLTRYDASPINRISPLLALATVRGRRGEDGVWELLDEATAAADGSGEPQWIVCARQSRAEMHWLAKHLDSVAPLIHQPTLILHARDDDMSHPRNAHRLRDRLGGPVALHLLDDCYHMIHVDRQRDLVGDMTADFFGAPPAGRPMARRLAEAAGA